MDGSHFPLEKPLPEYSEYGSDYDDPALKNTPEYWARRQPATGPKAYTRRIARQVINELRRPYMDCHCGCRGLNHIDPAARRILLDLQEIQTR